MKRTTRIAAIALVGVLTLSGLSVLAAEGTAAPAKGGNRPFAAGMNHKAGFKGWGWNRKELTEEEKAARIEERKAALAAKLAEGKITQEQYDNMLAKIESGEFRFNGWGNRNKKDNANRGEARAWNRGEKKELTEEEKAAQLETFKAVLAAQLESGKITQEQYDNMLAKREAGQFGPQFGNRDKQGEKPQWNRGEKKELTEEEKAARIEKQKAALAAKLAEGKITQEQYDQILAKIESGEFGFRFNRWGGNRGEQGKKPQWNRGEKPEWNRENQGQKKWEGKPNFGGFRHNWNKGPKAPQNTPAETPAAN